MNCLASRAPLVPGRRWSHTVGSEHSERGCSVGRVLCQLICSWVACSDLFWDLGSFMLEGSWLDKVGGSQPVEQVLLCSSSDCQPQTSTCCFPKAGTSKLAQPALLWCSFNRFWNIVINMNSWIAANLCFAFFSYQGLQMFVFLYINTIWKYYPCLLIAVHVFTDWAWKNKET